MVADSFGQPLIQSYRQDRVRDQDVALLNMGGPSSKPGSVHELEPETEPERRRVSSRPKKLKKGVKTR